MNEIKNLAAIIFSGLLTGCTYAGCDYDIRTEDVICDDSQEVAEFLAQEEGNYTKDLESSTKSQVTENELSILKRREKM